MNSKTNYVTKTFNIVNLCKEWNEIAYFLCGKHDFYTIIDDAMLAHLVCGKLHSEHGLPAAVQLYRNTAYLITQWFNQSKAHRDNDLPAMIIDYTVRYTGLSHAVTDDDATKVQQCWMNNGKIHREGNKPAAILNNGTKEYIRNGVLSRPDIDGVQQPVVEFADGNAQYLVGGLLIKINKATDVDVSRCTNTIDDADVDNTDDTTDDTDSEVTWKIQFTTGRIMNTFNMFSSDVKWDELTAKQQNDIIKYIHNAANNKLNSIVIEWISPKELYTIIAVTLV